MKRLVLVRHAESRWNAERRVQGQQCAGLSDLGQQQAKIAAEALAVAHPDAAVVTSDLLRTRETTAFLEAALGRDALVEPGLRERNFGNWEGRTGPELAGEDPDRWARWINGEDVIDEIGGETRTDLVARVVPVFNDLLDATPDGGTTIAITHGGAIWHGAHGILSLPPGTFAGLANTSVTELLRASDAAGSRDPLPVVLDRWNDIGHLPVDLRSAWNPRVAPVRPAVVGP